MKIGTFAKKYGLSVYTVRYYISLGILCPQKINKQYIFDGTCIEDMNLINELRKCLFPLKDIKHVLSIKRISQLKDKTSTDHLISIYENNRSELQKKRNRIDSAISLLARKINMLHESDLKQEGLFIQNGMDLGFISFLVCPKCGNTLSFKDMIIENNAAYHGHISCSCGYFANIKDGIILTSSMDKNAQVWYTFDNIIKTISTDYMNLLFQSYEWMYNKLSEESLNNKTFFCLGESGAEFIYEHINKLGPDNHYIIYDVALETIQFAKKRLDSLGSDYKILYLVGYAENLPLKKSCIDFFIDDCSSFFDLFDGGSFLIEKIKHLLKREAIISGLFLSYDKNAPTLINIRKYWPNALTKFMNFNIFKNSLKENLFTIIDSKQQGTSSVPGYWPNFQDANDKLTFNTYYAKSKR